MNKLFKLQTVRQSNEGEFKLEKVINIGESYFTEFYQIYNNVKLKNKDMLEGIIKVKLSEDNMYEQLKEGIMYNGQLYRELLTTPAGMKLEGEAENGFKAYKCESFFYNVRLNGIREKLYEVMSADRLKNLEGKEISINKEVSSRIALATSTIIGSTPLDISKICVVPKSMYEYTNNYAYYDKDRKFQTGELTLKHEAFDGQGLMSNELAEQIRIDLKEKHRIDFAVTRYYHATACKGVLLRFDFKSYFKSMGIYTIKDIYGKERRIDEIEAIMPPSMVKWLGLGDLLESKQYYENSEYKAINERLYITKTNKADDKIKDKIRLNYQALTNTALSKEDLVEMAREEIESYKKLTSFEEIDYIKLAMGNQTDKDLMVLAIDKLGEEALKLKYVRQVIKSTIEKQIKELSAGKILSKGNYCIGCIDPIAFCNRIIGIETAEELQVGEIVQGGCPQGNRVVYRSPIAYFAEISQYTLSSRDYIEEYGRECLFVNCKDDFSVLKSGSDWDGDGFAVIDNPILYNAIITTDTPFVNLFDGQMNFLPYNEDNYYQAIVKGSGNLIGKIAMNNTKLCIACSSMSAVSDGNGGVCLYSDLRNAWQKAHNINNKYEKNTEEYYEYEDKIREQFKAFVKQNFVFISELEAEERQRLIRKLFNNNLHKFGRILEASMISIDTPKTLFEIPEILNRELKEQNKGLYKPYFLKHLREVKEREITKHRNGFDDYSKYVIRECLIPCIEGLKAEEGKTPNKAFYELYGAVEGEISEELYEIYKENIKDRNLLSSTQKMERDSITLCKLISLNLTPDVVASTGWKKKIKPRFMVSFFPELLADNLNALPSLTDNLVETDEVTDIVWKGKYYKKTKEDVKISKKYTQSELIQRNIYKRIRIQFNNESDFETLGDYIEIVDNVINENVNVISSKVDVEELWNGEYFIVEKKIDKSGIRGTIICVKKFV